MQVLTLGKIQCNKQTVSSQIVMPEKAERAGRRRHLRGTKHR